MFNFGAIGQGIAGIAQGVFGVITHHKGRRIRKRAERDMAEAWKKRTNFEIPKEIQANYNQAQNELGSKPAIQQYMEENANMGLSNDLGAVSRYATSSADALAAAAGANRQAQMSRNQAAMAGAEMRQANLQNVMQAGSQLGDYRTMQWDMNVNMPFLLRLEEAQGMKAMGYGLEQEGVNQVVEGFNKLGESSTNFFAGMGGGMMGGK